MNLLSITVLFGLFITFMLLLYLEKTNFALQGYSRAHPRGGPRLVVFEWVGLHPTQPDQTPIRARASPETSQKAMRCMVKKIKLKVDCL